MAFKKLVKCPSCNFANRFGDAKCIICKAELPTKEEDRELPDFLKERAEKAGGDDEPAAGGDDRKPTMAINRGQLERHRQARGAAKDGAPAKPSTPTSRVPRPDAGATRRTVAWLCCDPLPPIPLGIQPTLIIGRANDCDLVLPHKEVSRHHTVIKVHGRQIVFNDEGSSNGTFLNGKRVLSGVLKVGDMLTVGPYELALRSNKEMVQRADDGSTSSLNMTRVVNRTEGAALEGSLEEVPLAEVLQGIEFNKKSGTLTVAAGARRGKLVLCEGVPWFAKVGSREGEEAVLSMLKLKMGRFSFHPDPEPGERSMKATITGLLLEASRRVDEGGDGSSSSWDDSSAAVDADDEPTEVGLSIDEAEAGWSLEDEDA